MIGPLATLGPGSWRFDGLKAMKQGVHNCEVLLPKFWGAGFAASNAEGNSAGLSSVWIVGMSNLGGAGMSSIGAAGTSSIRNSDGFLVLS